MLDADRLERDRRDWGLLLIILVALGVVISASVVPGIFIVDENNHLVSVVALRHGHVTVANTSGLTPSPELLFFDPAPFSRAVDSTPVAPTVPPLYAPIALAFSLFGWRGLVGLNTLSYLITAAMVFAYTRRYAVERFTPWLAAGTFAFAGFSIEYAMGLWPQSLSVALCTGAIITAGLTIETNGLRSAGLAGLLLGIATGVRYQNAAVLATVGAAILFWSNQRIRSAIAYGVSAIVPVFISAAINHVRLHSWNPISKGSGYLHLPIVQDAKSSWLDPLTMFWARVVDYSYRPHLMSHTFEGWVTYDVVTGAHLIFGFAVKKAFLQSAPWGILGLMLMILAWLPRFRVDSQRRRQIQLLSLVTFVTLGLFAFSGIWRDDGLSFNQRYLLEIVPLTAIVFAWSLDKFALRVRGLVVGCVGGTLAALLILLTTPMSASATPSWTMRLLALLKVPLFLAAGLAYCWFIANFRQRFRPTAAVLAGICLGWAVTMQLVYDVPIAQGARRYYLQRTRALAAVLPDKSALITYWGTKEAAGPLLLDRDLVVIDSRIDTGASAPQLIRELLKQNRRVFLLDDPHVPADVRERILSTSQEPVLIDASVPLLELKRYSP